MNSSKMDRRKLKTYGSMGASRFDGVMGQPRLFLISLANKASTLCWKTFNPKVLTAALQERDMKKNTSHFWHPSSKLLEAQPPCAKKCCSFHRYPAAPASCKRYNDIVPSCLALLVTYPEPMTISPNNWHAHGCCKSSNILEAVSRPRGIHFLQNVSKECKKSFPTKASYGEADNKLLGLARPELKQ